MSPSLRTPPHSSGSERALLGSALLAPEVIADVSDLSPDDFFDPRHAVVWDAMLSLHATHRPIELVGLRDLLVARNRLERAGGDELLMGVTESLPSAAFAGTYARTIRDLAQRRRMILACLEQAERGYDLALETPGYIEQTEARIGHVASSTSSDTAVVHIRDAVADAFEAVRIAAEAGGNGVTGLSSGLEALDRVTTGFHGGELIIIGGRPGMGKSSLARLTAVSAAKSGAPAMVFSLEMPNRDLARGLLAAEADIDVQQLRSARIGRDGWSRLTNAAGSLAGLPIYLDETPGISLAQVRTRCRRLRSKEGKLGVVVVDYLQLMRGSGRSDNREQEISEVSRGLKELAKELNCPVIALVQLNRKVEERADKRPLLSDIRESGSIEQDADVVAFVYRDAYYAAKARHEATKSAGRGGAFVPPPIEDGDSAEIIVAKQRNGPLETAHVRFVAPFARFENAASHGYGFGDS